MSVFPIALVWSRPEKADVAVKLLLALEPVRTRLHLVGIECLLRPHGATICLQVELPRYPKEELEPLRAQVKQAGGTMLEPLLLPEGEQAAAIAALRSEGECRPCPDFSGAAQVLKSHLASIRAAPVRRPKAPEPAPAEQPRPPGVEGRRFPRHDVILGVEFKTEEDFTREYALNISKGGVFLTSSQSPPVNSFASLSIQLPDGTTATTRARVVHVREAPGGFGIGLDFQCEKDPTFWRALESYLASRESG
jgi:hypothetical protein